MADGHDAPAAAHPPADDSPGVVVCTPPTQTALPLGLSLEAGVAIRSHRPRSAKPAIVKRSYATFQALETFQIEEISEKYTLSLKEI